MVTLHYEPVKVPDWLEKQGRKKGMERGVTIDDALKNGQT